MAAVKSFVPARAGNFGIGGLTVRTTNRSDQHDVRRLLGRRDVEPTIAKRALSPFNCFPGNDPFSLNVFARRRANELGLLTPAPGTLGTFNFL
jgi:hypothetical protein